MYRIAVMGDRDSIYGLAALGVDIYPLHNDGEAAKTLRKLTDGRYAVIYITEAWLSKLEKEVERVADNMLPAIIPIPGISGNTGKGMANVRRTVEKAVGSDIIFNDKK